MLEEHPPQQELTDAMRVGKVLDLHPKTVLAAARAGKIPCVKLSARCIKFSIPDVLAALRSGYTLKARAHK